MRSFFVFLTLFFLLPFSATSLAGEATPDDVGASMRSECGINPDGSVIGADSSICEEDIAFGMLHEMFPSIIDEITPFWRLTEISGDGEGLTKPGLLGEYRGDKVFFVLFDLFFDMVLVCLAVYFVMVVASIFVRIMKGENLKDNGAEKDSPGSWSLGILLGGTFLIPYKKFFVGQLIVFTIGIVALSMANFFQSIFLSGNQAVFANLADPARPTIVNTSEGVQDRHDFYADTFYRQLTRVSLCRMKTAEYQLSALDLSVNDRTRFKEIMQCVAPNDEQAVFSWGNGDVSAPPFVWASKSLSDFTNGGDYHYGGLNSLSMSSKANTANFCSVNEEPTSGYECGEFNLNQPDWSQNALVRLLPSPAIIREHVKKLRSLAAPGTRPETIESQIQSGWLSLKEDLKRNYIEIWRELDRTQKEMAEAGMDLVNVNNEIVRKSSIIEDLRNSNIEPHLQQASLYYHLEAMNSLMFGQSFYAEEAVDSAPDGVSGARYLGESYFDGIVYHMSVANRFGEHLNDVHCADYYAQMADSYKTEQFLNPGGGVDVRPSASKSECLDFDTGTVREYTPFLKRTKEEAAAYHEEKEAEFIRMWQDPVSLLASQRRAIERSFAESVNNNYTGKWWADMRQKGYLATADYAQSIGQTVEAYKRSLLRLVNNYNFEPGVTNSSYVNVNVISNGFDNGHFYTFKKNGNAVLESTRSHDKRIDRYVFDGAWIAEQERALRARATAVDSTDDFFDIGNYFTKPVSYIDRIGFSFPGRRKTEETCLESPRGCPFPLSDPIVELSLMGQDMVDTAIQFFGIGLTIKAMNSKQASSLADKIFSGRKNSGDVVNKTGAFSKIIDVVQSTQSKASRVLAYLEVVINTLIPLMTMLLIFGAALAYLLPLIPKIYLYMNFISWLMVLVMSSFAVLLWSLFWIRFKEKRDLLKTAGYHYGVELLFKPTFSLVAVLFAWYFFYVVAFVVGVSMGAVWSITGEGEGVIRMMVNNFMLVIMMSLVYFVGLHYAYQLIDDLITELMKKLGVRNIKDNDKIGDFVKAIMFDAGNRFLKQQGDKFAKTGLAGKVADKQSKLAQKMAGIEAFKKGYQAASSSNSKSPKGSK